MPIDYDSLPLEDLQALKDGKYDNVSMNTLLTLKGANTVTNNPADYPQGKSSADQDQMRREFLNHEKANKTTGEKLQGTGLPDAFNPALPTARAKSVSDFIQRVAPESAGKLPARLFQGAYEAIKGQTDPIIEGFTTKYDDPSYSIGSEMKNNAVGTLKGLADAVVNPTGLMGTDKAKEAWLTDPAGSLLAVAPMVKPGFRAVKEIPAAVGTAVGKTLNAFPDSMVTPESLARSALKPYIGDSRARNTQTAKGIETFLYDKNATGSPRKLLDRNVAEMEEVVGRQNILLDEKGRVRANIAPIESSLNEFINESRATPGTADASVVAAEKVLADIKNHPDFNPANNTIGVNTAQTMKQNIWRHLREKGAFNTDAGSMLNDAMWSSADGMAKIVSDVIPEMKAENMRYGELANLNKMLVRSVNRIANNNIISLHTAMQLIRGDFKGFGMAVAMKTIDHPTFKSYLAQQMAKAKGRPVRPAEVNTALSEIKDQFNPEVLPGKYPSIQEEIPGSNAVGLEQGGMPTRGNMGPSILDSESLPASYRGDMPTLSKPREVSEIDWQNYIRRNKDTVNPETVPGRQSSAVELQQPNGLYPGLEDGAVPSSRFNQPVIRNPEQIPGRQSSQMDIILDKSDPLGIRGQR